MTAYDIRIWVCSSDVCSSDLQYGELHMVSSSVTTLSNKFRKLRPVYDPNSSIVSPRNSARKRAVSATKAGSQLLPLWGTGARKGESVSMSSLSLGKRSEEHTSELQSLMRISYAVFCLK